MSAPGEAKRAVLFGATDFARIALEYLQSDSDYEVEAFTVDREFLDCTELAGLPVVPFESLETTHPPADVELFVAIGFKRVNELRAEASRRCREKGYRLLSFVSSHALVADNVSIGDNCFIFEANVVQPYVRIGDNVILWSGNHIGHDVVIEDDVFIASHAVVSGNVRIGAGSFVGVNATLRDAVTIAPRCVIGAGALIMKDTSEGDVYSVRGTEPLDTKSWDLRNF